MREALRRAGVARLTVSLDTLEPGRFAELTRRDALPEVLAGIRAASRAGFACDREPSDQRRSLAARLKIDTVLMRGVNDDEMCTLLDFAAEARFALGAIANNKSLLKCDPETVKDSMVHLAAMGLSLNPAAQQAARPIKENMGSQ